VSRRWRTALIVIALLIAAVLLLKACSPLPPLANRTVTHAMTDTNGTRLGRVVVPLVTAHAPNAGIYAMRDARNAFAARARLAAVAEKSLDVQYYIWHDDLSGTLLFDALRDAANRGVRVRLLLDDNGTSGIDSTLAALDAHPNIEVRLFNPFVIRKPRVVNYVTDFSRLNRRMHNKSFTADNQVTIVGGRNVGDEYFGAGDAVLFADLDVMAVGPVVREVSWQFDRYWSSDSAYPLDRVIHDAGPPPQRKPDPAAAAYLEAIRKSEFVHQLVTHTLPIDWVPAHMISDDPAKGLGRASHDQLLSAQLKAMFGEPKSRLDLVSPYFVPGEYGTEMFRTWAAHGVKIRVLTNALEATDVAAVHSGYAKSREALLSGGVTLFELRRTATGARPSGFSGSGSSQSSLHAKTFAVDGARVFVGSFNFDPRSMKLNTEMGFVIDSPTLAGRITETFDKLVPADAYEVHLTPEQKLYWQFGSKRYDKEPGTTGWQRFLVWVTSKLPIESLL
jgi:putative cardiolipin synthase